MQAIILKLVDLLWTKIIIILCISVESGFI